MDRSTAQHLLAVLRNRRTEMVAMLTRWARIESPSNDPLAQQAIFAAIETELQQLGFSCQRIAGTTSGGQLVAQQQDEVSGERPRQLILGHCDTVWATGTLKTMPVESKAGVLYGPGVFDMKGGLVQAIFALATLRELQIDLPMTPVVFINSDEEIGSKDSYRQIQRIAKSVQRVWVVEPSLGEAGRLKTSRKGVGRYIITAKGRSAHAGLDPEKGISAVHAIAEVVTTLAGMNDPQRGTSVNVGTVQGGTRPNVVAAEAVIEVDIRVSTAAEAERVDAMIKQLKSSIEGAELEIIVEPARPPMEPTPANRQLWESAKLAAHWLDLPLEEAAAGGGSDGNWTSQTTATLDGLGAVGGGAHAVNEHISEEKLAERAALLAVLLASDPLES